MNKVYQASVAAISCPLKPILQLYMLVTTFSASTERLSTEKEVEGAKELLTIELQSAMLALEAKHSETLIGELFVLSCLLYLKHIFISEILSRAALASHTGHGKESLSNHAIVTSKLLEDRQEFPGWKVQEGEGPLASHLLNKL